MKRIWTALLAAILLIPMTFQSQAQAAVNISVLIDGVKLYTPQAPVMIQGRVMLPMRSIFEALDASVKWNQKTKTVTAVKDGTTVILKINSKTATINSKTVALDVPAKNLKGNTMVPVRFVSEALGQKIGWNSKTKTVTVTTTNNSGGNNTGIAPVNYVTLRDIGNAGDGRDLQVSFSKSSTEPLISHYRVMIVKQSKTLNQTEAQRVSSAAYTSVYPTGSDPMLTLTSGSKDVDGDLIRDNQAYKAYVLAVSKTGGAYALSSASPSLTLTNTNSVNGATNVKASDVSDYGDGRDLQVSFTRAQNESNVSNYRVFVVKTKDAANFNLAAAKSVSSQNYSTVSKTSTTNTTLSTTLSSSARDTSGELIRSGVAYTVFVQSVSSNESVLASNLSSGSASITLSTGNTTVPFITQVTDIGDAGDGRDLRVSFNKVSNESSIHSYRVFVVKDSSYSSFNLSRANTASSYNYYTHVNKTGNNITNLTLSSGARDVDGATIRNGVYYRVFVMAVDNNNANNNVLSAPSSSIILSSSYNVGAVTSLSVTDVNNYNDGRDLQVSFYRPSDQSNISHYQVFVVKSSNSYFDLYRANNLSSYYYTQISKNNSSSNYMSQVLNSGSRDIDGELIRNGVSYRVYVLSVGYSTSNNALSDYASITLGNANQNVNPVSTPSLTLNGNNGNGSDLKVTFGPAYGESYIDHYRVIVVKSNKSLNVSQAYSNGYYTLVNKTGGTITRDLANTTKDSDGDLIQRGQSYRVYVLSVGNSYSNYSNALSAVSNAVTIQGVTQVAAVTNVTAADVSDFNNASDLKVSFTNPANEANIKEYRIMVVKQANAGSFTVAQANKVGNDNYDSVTVGTNFNKVLRAETRDVEGQPIRNSVDYQVFVLSVSNNGSISNALSAPSATIKLTGTAVTVPSDVYAGIESTNGNASDIVVRFTPASNAGTIAEYRIMVVPSDQGFGLDDANRITNGNLYTSVAPTNSKVETTLSARIKDVNGEDVKSGYKYKVFILVVADGTVSTTNAMSKSSKEFEIPNPLQTTAVTAKLDANGKLQVDFKRAIDERGITAYRLLFVEEDNIKTFTLKAATDAAAKEDKNATIKPDGKDVSTLIDIPAKDALGKDIKDNAKYAVYVLSVQSQDKKLASSAQSATPLSEASKTLVVLKKTP
ncbi:copper amine oxidase N-terminal domain-containing protein [Paenibacillus sp. HGF5]|uniref:copper amine oxidase N-terminal domain-containing protein n=1 Tax=Paenibacillus sp. HGF5 TaxID=908341 RepID=UPI0002072F6F|nr:copper amine oxidase N-terminal domain-containing protein [Paenibacillus sp. HGF5]EGG31899.1 copper amine oxidase N-terminal domain protein [Paenibacillus sp. HGF5]